MRILIGIALAVLLGFSRAQAFTNLGNGTLQSDGSAADTQAAINAAAGGNTVLIPSGSFTWNTPVTINKYVKVKGAGAGGFLGHSDSSVAVGTGSKTFVISATNVLPFSVGQNVQAMFENTYNGVQRMNGTVSSWNGTTLVMNVTSSTGSGTYGMWVFSTPPATIVTNNASSSLIPMAASTAGSPELSGLYFTFAVGTSPSDHIVINPAQGRPVLIHDCWFSRPGNSGNRSVFFADNKGIVYRCSFDDGFYCNELNGTGNMDEAFVFKNIALSTSWTTGSTMGMADVGGTNNAYVEDCYLAGIFLQSIDPDDNARVVLRYLVMDNTGMTSHGADTSSWGVRHVELYNSKFIFNDAGSNTLNLNWWYATRGGTGVCFSNIMPNISSSQWGNKSVQSTVMLIESPYRNQGPYACLTNYPAPHQVGQGYVSGSSAEPAYYWGNTGNGNVPAPSQYTCNSANVCPNCASTPGPTFYLQNGRDYFSNVVKPGYVPYTYPHPLRAAGSTAGSNQPPVAVASASPTTGVAPLQVTFSSAGSTDPEGTALTYNWAFGDGATSTSANPSHIYQAAGTFTAQLTVSDGTNATSSNPVVITATNSTTGNYATSFPLTESPISEGGRWLNGKTDGLDWANIRTTPGLAFGTETGAGGYDDSTAVLKGSWGPNQTASGRVHVGVRAGGGTYKEVEIRLRSAISARSCTGYEINFSLDSGAGAYTQIVRWNGPLGSFTYLDSRAGSQYQINEGDEVKAVISGNIITAYIRGQLVSQATDNTFTSGSPGMGFYLQGTGTNDFGFTSYSATDGSSRPSPPTNLHIVTGP